MFASRIHRITMLAAITAVASYSALCAAQEQPPPEAPPPAEEQQAPDVPKDVRTPPRLSFTDGEVSFWRPGADDWAPAQINIALAPGDELYAGDRANLEIQIGPRAYVRAGADTQIGLENQEPDFLQLKVTSGHASVDIRSIAAGHAIELDTPNAAFTIERTGYYRVDIDNATTAFISRRGGQATMVPAGGEAVAIAPSEEVVLEGADNPHVATYVAPEIDAWDRWNYDRTDHLIDSVSARYVSPGMYGADALDHYGNWRVVDPYGPVWVPEGVASGWAPYSTGRWVWDPYFGWSWVDQAPWGWAPYHYGRWVHVGGYWGWAPGPVVVTPVYAPALVAFFGGGHFGVSIGIGVPAVSWVALGWGEPCVPWWGPVGFVGHPWWGGWGGPRVVNNVVVNRTSVVNINNITYQNINVHDAVIGTRQDRFGRDMPEHVRLREGDLHNMQPVHGALPVKPVASSLVPRTEHAFRPPESVLSRRVVATRAPHDPAPALRAEGLNAPPRTSASAPQLVSPPRGPHAATTAPRAPFGQQGGAERPRPSQPPRFGAPQQPAPAPRRPAPGHPAPATSSVPAGRGAPAAPAEPAVRGGGRPAAPPHAPQPRVPAPAPRAPEPRGEAMPRAPVQQSAPPAQHPAPRIPQAEQAPRQPHAQLPGEPANRLYRPAPPAQPPHQAPAQRGAAHPAPASRSAAPPRERAPH